MKSYEVHYRNKYPKGAVFSSDSSIDAYDENGVHCVAIRKNGAGQWQCVSEEKGCKDRHDLSPLPKDARVHKLYPDGKIGRSEEADEREEVASELSAHECGGAGKVPSIQELHVHHNPKASKDSGFHSGTTWAEMKPKA